MLRPVYTGGRLYAAGSVIEIDEVDEQVLIASGAAEAIIKHDDAAEVAHDEPAEPPKKPRVGKVGK